MSSMPFSLRNAFVQTKNFVLDANLVSYAHSVFCIIIQNFSLQVTNAPSYRKLSFFCRGLVLHGQRELTFRALEQLTIPANSGVISHIVVFHYSGS